MSGPPLLMTNTGSVDRLADVERRQVELELRVLHGVGGQHVGSERRHAPLHPLAHVPDVVLARAPRRRVPREAPRDVAEKPAAQELVGAVIRRVTVGARVVALATAPLEARPPTCREHDARPRSTGARAAGLVVSTATGRPLDAILTRSVASWFAALSDGSARPVVASACTERKSSRLITRPYSATTRGYRVATPRIAVCGRPA